MTSEERKTTTLELQALKKIASKLTTAAKGYEKNHAEVVKSRQDLLASGEYKTEEEIQDAYGWGEIDEGQQRMLLDALESGESEAVEDTVWSLAARILWKEIQSYNSEIHELEYMLMSPERQKRQDEESAKWAAEWEVRRGKRAKGATL